MYGRRDLVGGGLLVAALICSDPGPAKADIMTAIYDDAKGIITELLTDEVAQQIVPNIACYAGRKPWSSPPGRGTARTAAMPSLVIKVGDQQLGLDALYYYPQTLQRIYTRQFGALRPTAIHE